MRIILCTVLCTAMAGCTLPSTKWELKEKTLDNKSLQLVSGMSKQEVIKIIGLPDRKEGEGKLESYTYYIPYGGCYFIAFNENGKLDYSTKAGSCW